MDWPPRHELWPRLLAVSAKILNRPLIHILDNRYVLPRYEAFPYASVAKLPHRSIDAPPQLSSPLALACLRHWQGSLGGFHKRVLLLVDVLITRAIPFGLYITAPDSRKLSLDKGQTAQRCLSVFVCMPVHAYACTRISMHACR